MIFSDNRFPPIGSKPKGKLFRIMLLPHRQPLPHNVSTSSSVLASKHHVVGGLAAKDGGAEVAPDHFELIGDMLPRH